MIHKNISTISALPLSFLPATCTKSSVDAGDPSPPPIRKRADTYVWYASRIFNLLLSPSGPPRLPVLNARRLADSFSRAVLLQLSPPCACMFLSSFYSYPPHLDLSWSFRRDDDQHELCMVFTPLPSPMTLPHLNRLG